MDAGHPHRRNQARAIAISRSLEARRAAVVAKGLLVAAAIAALIETVTIAHGLIGFSHP